MWTWLNTEFLSGKVHISVIYWAKKCTIISLLIWSTKLSIIVETNIKMTFPSFFNQSVNITFGVMTNINLIHICLSNQILLVRLFGHVFVISHWKINILHILFFSQSFIFCLVDTLQWVLSNLIINNFFLRLISSEKFILNICTSILVIKQHF